MCRPARGYPRDLQPARRAGPVPSALERLCDLREGQGANCGHSITVRQRIAESRPAIWVGGKLKIRESDLQEQVEDDLGAWAAKLDASWPEVPEKRKAELRSAPGLTQPRSRRNAPARRGVSCALSSA